MQNKEFQETKGEKRNEKEKNKPMQSDQWSFMFNAIIEQAGLRELPLNGRLYTWANNQESPTYEKLDRVLTCPAWEEKYPNYIASFC